MSIVLRVSDHTKWPGPRYIWQGPFSGEWFREKIAKELFRKHHRIEIILDDTAGYGSSFIEELFGGLVRNDIVPPTEALDRIIPVSKDDATLYEEAMESIKDAIAKKRGR